MAVATTTCAERDYFTRATNSPEPKARRTLSTHNNDLNRDGEGQLVAVPCTQLLHHNQNHAADQRENQRRNVGVEKATNKICKGLGQGGETPRLQRVRLQRFQHETEVTYVNNSQRATIWWHMDAQDVLEHRNEDLQTCSSHEASDEGF